VKRGLPCAHRRGPLTCSRPSPPEPLSSSTRRQSRQLAAVASMPAATGPSRPPLSLSARHGELHNPCPLLPLAAVHLFLSSSRISRKTELHRSTPRHTTVATGLHSLRHDVQEIHDGAPRRPALLIWAKNHRRRRQLPRDAAGPARPRRRLRHCRNFPGSLDLAITLTVSLRAFCLYPRLAPLPVAFSRRSRATAAADLEAAVDTASLETPWRHSSKRTSLAPLPVVLPCQMVAGNPLRRPLRRARGRRRLTAGGPV